MRKMIICMLLLCLAVGLASLLVIPAAAYTTEMEVQTFYETHLDDPYIREKFIFPNELSPLGNFEGMRFHSGTISGWDYVYRVSIALDEYDKEDVELRILEGVVKQEFFLRRHYGEPREVVLLDRRYTKGSFAHLDSSYTSSDTTYRIIRGSLEYIYSGSGIHCITWIRDEVTFRLYVGVETKLMESGDNIIADLLSLENEPFEEAQARLLAIGNSTPSAPEISCGKDYPHSYSDQWRSDAYTHYNLCSCGAKGNEGFHADENQDGACDICNYDPNAKADPDPNPVVDPTEPSQPPTEPATQPTTQPTTTPATQPTASTPAEPQSPASGLWIGIAAVGILAVAAVILVIRKKKTE